MPDCLLHRAGCDGRSPCNVELEVRAQIASQPETLRQKRQRAAKAGAARTPNTVANAYRGAPARRQTA